MPVSITFFFIIIIIDSIILDEAEGEGYMKLDCYSHRKIIYNYNLSFATSSLLIS